MNLASPLVAAPPSRVSTRGGGAVRALVALLVALCATLVLPAVATADDTVSWGLAPADNDLGAGRPNYSYALEPGQVVSDSVVVTNHSTVPLELRTYAVDAFTTSTGDLDLLTADQESTDLGSWIVLSAPTVSVEPGATVDVPFTLTVPADARPGDHSAGIVTSVAEQGDTSTVTVDKRLALRVHARVAGELAPALTVTGVSVEHHGSANPFQAPRATVRYTITNTGNARVVPVERVTVDGLLGAGRSAGPTELPEVLPGSSLDRVVEVDGLRPSTKDWATVDVSATAVGIGGGASVTVTGSASTWALPWGLLVLVLLVVALAVWVPLVGLPLVRRLRERRATSAPATGAAPGTGAEPTSGTEPTTGTVPAAGAVPAAAPAGTVTVDEHERALAEARAQGRAEALAAAQSAAAEVEAAASADAPAAEPDADAAAGPTTVQPTTAEPTTADPAPRADDVADAPGATAPRTE